MPFPPPGALPDLGMEAVSPALQANYSLMIHREAPRERTPPHTHIPVLTFGMGVPTLGSGNGRLHGPIGSTSSRTAQGFLNSTLALMPRAHRQNFLLCFPEKGMSWLQLTSLSVSPPFLLLCLQGSSPRSFSSTCVFSVGPEPNPQGPLLFGERCHSLLVDRTGSTCFLGGWRNRWTGE